MLRNQTVFFFCAIDFHLNTISTDPVKSMHNDQEITATNLVLQTPRNFNFYQDRLRQPLLDLGDLPDEIMALRIKLFVDVKNWFFLFFRVQDDRTIAASDDIFLLSDSFDQGVYRGFEAVSEHFFFHCKLFFRAILLTIYQVFELRFSFCKIFACVAMFFPDESPFLDNQLIVSFFLFLLFLLFLFGVAYKFTFLDGDNLKLFFTDFLFGEEPRRIDL